MSSWYVSIEFYPTSGYSELSATNTKTGRKVFGKDLEELKKKISKIEGY